MDSWSYGTSVFCPNGTSLLPSDHPRSSIAGFQHGIFSNEFDKDHVFMSGNGFSAVSSSCVVPYSLLHVEEDNDAESLSSSSKLSRIDFKLRNFMDYANNDGGTSSSSRDFTLPAKKPRASSSCYQNPLCQVYGCNTDLSSSKDYHKRHRVCEAHSKTSVVIVNGTQQRFCQQCSRFHFLSEFDNGKRSCRRRLAGHNERRRKPSFYFLPGKQRHKLLPQGRLISFKDEPAEVSGVSSSIWDLHEAVPQRSTCAHSLLSPKSHQSFSITQPNQTLNASSRIDYHQMQPPFWTDHDNNTKGSSTVDLLQLSSHLQRIDQQQRSFTYDDVKLEYNNELYFP